MKAEKALLRKQNILHAASRLIVQYGFDKTTMDDIAREAGVSKGALYLVWPGKDDLFDALLTFEMERLVQDFQSRMQADPQGGQLANLYQHALLALAANPLVRALYARDSRVLGDFVKRQDPARYTQRILFSVDLVRQMQSAGLIRSDLSPAVVAYVLSIISLGYLHIGSIIPPADQPPLEEQTQALMALVQSGLAGNSQGSDSAAGKQAIQELDEMVLEQYHQEKKE